MTINLKDVYTSPKLSKELKARTDLLFRYESIWFKGTDQFDQACLKASELASRTLIICFTDTKNCGYCKLLRQEVFYAWEFLDWYDKAGVAALRLDKSQLHEQDEYEFYASLEEAFRDTYVNPETGKSVVNHGVPCVLAIRCLPACAPGGDCGLSLSKMGKETCGYSAGFGVINWLNWFASNSGLPGYP